MRSMRTDDSGIWTLELHMIELVHSDAGMGRADEESGCSDDAGFCRIGQRTEANHHKQGRTNYGFDAPTCQPAGYCAEDGSE
jgi:hypothetical protein